MKQFVLLVCCVACLPCLYGQGQLEVYVREGLERNEGVRQQQLSLRKSLYALKEARSLFFPMLTAGVSYSLSDGGRTIAIPVGDLLNPVYSSLNELTGSDVFPQVGNVEERLNPDNYYDARLRFSLPVVDAEIYYNKEIRKQAVQLEEIELRLYKRELVKEIKVAYFQYVQAREAVGIYEHAVSLAQENLRMNRSLQQNGKVNHTVVLRSESEVTRVEAMLASSLVTQANSAAYFNFLLNKPLESPIVCEWPSVSPDVLPVAGEPEELSKLYKAETVLMLNKKLSQSFVIPKLRTFVDVGSQGFDWRVDRKTGYYLFGVSLEWNFSLGGRNVRRVRQVSIEQERLQSQISGAREQLNLRVLVARNALLDAEQQYEASLKQVAAAERYYGEQAAVYREGSLLYIELLDAYDQYVRAKVESNVARCATYIRQAELERAHASFNLQ